MNAPYKLVAAGIYQVRLSLPFALESVNCYLLRDADGWAILDAGLNTSKARKEWLATFDDLAISPTDITRIILTHTHPDHYGLAGWLQALGRDETGKEPPVYMSSLESAQVDRVWKDADNQMQRMADYFYCCGLPSDRARTVAFETGKVAARTLPYPQTVTIIEAGTRLQIGERQFDIIHTPGHSDGQIIFYDPADELLLCGDQVLIKITPHIGTWPGYLPHPLERYLNSLQRLKSLEVRLALPGHRASISDWQSRLTELEAHHEERLNHTLEAVNGDTTVAEVSKSVFRLGSLNVHEARFAIAETLSHLEYLVKAGQVKRQEGNVWWYSLS